MARDSGLSSIGMSITGTAAKHPRLAMTLVLLLLMVAAQGTVGAETFDFGAGTNGTGTVDDGP